MPLSRTGDGFEAAPRALDEARANAFENGTLIALCTTVAYLFLSLAAAADRTPP